jgi:ketosteroid isomerase-like protein
MSQESTTPDLVELARFTFEAANRRDFDAILGIYAPNAVWLGTVDDAVGVAAIRDLWVSYYSAFEELRLIVDEVVDFSNGVVLAAHRHVGRLVGGLALSERRVFVYKFVDGRIVQVNDFADIDEARAAAERLAESRE